MIRKYVTIFFIVVFMSLSIGICFSFSADKDTPENKSDIANPNIADEILAFDEDIRYQGDIDDLSDRDLSNIPEETIAGEIKGDIVDIKKMDKKEYILKVKDKDLKDYIEVTVDPLDITIIKEAKRVDLSDIKVADTVNIVFIRQGKKINAKFINILPQKDLETK